MIDRMPVPYGLIRFGVAPDHQSIKAVSKRYEKVRRKRQCPFRRQCAGRPRRLGRRAAGALRRDDPRHRRARRPPLEIPGGDLPGVVGSAAFVGWYNGHPEFADLDPPLDVAAAAVIGNGNVALDFARILSKTPAEFDGSDIVRHALDALGHSAIRTINILGRRGPHQIAMTPKELGELGHLEDASPVVDLADFPPLERRPARAGPAQVGHPFARFRRYPPAGKSKTIVFDFFAKPVRIEGEGKAERIIVERTRLDEKGAAIGTGETYEVPASLIVTCIGYKTPPVEGVPYDERGRNSLNAEGVIGDGLYCVGWARRGPTGTIGTNRPDGYEVADRIAGEMPPGSSGAAQGAAGLNRLLESRGVDTDRL